MPDAPPITLVVLDANAPWVRALTSAMPAGVTVRWLRPLAAGSVRRGDLWPAVTGRWRASGGAAERPFLYPGWRKFPGWSARRCVTAVRSAVRGAAGRVVVMYTLPFYCRVAARLKEYPAVYFAFDPYEEYDGWDPAAVRRGEDELFAHCRAVFAVSDPLADDFRRRTDKPVYVQPNGLPAERLRPADRPPRPADLPTSGRPVVGCVGQINGQYDWDLLEETAHACPEYDFVFVGPVLDTTPPDARRRIERFWARPNAHWLGRREPHELPAYLAHFDVCLSPLRVNASTDRRSLLRLYDYLATDKPVISTPVWSARAHAGFVQTAGTTDELVPLLREAMTAGRSVDVSARREYLADHTWEARAELLASNLRAVLKSPERSLQRAR